MTHPNPFQPSVGLRWFSKFVSASTLILIFAGGLVTSTGSGLSVPDWPLSYGTLFPPMVGGIRFEHTHRMIAGGIGMLMLILAIWLGIVEKRRWVKLLGFFALGAVICQAILGGITVLFMLPKPISITHAILAQTFFVLTVIIAYSQSADRQQREKNIGSEKYIPIFAKLCATVSGLVYIQLILGALMRHTASGLAIPDFPRMGGTFIPQFNAQMLSTINTWRFAHNLDPVAMTQVVIHFAHRMGACVVTIAIVILAYQAKIIYHGNIKMTRLSWYLVAALLVQLTLGALTVLTGKAALITSLHVVVGAATLALSILLTLQSYPLSLSKNL